MNIVNMNCRNCQQSPAEFASAFMEGDHPTVGEMQSHMDVFFKPTCGECGVCDWEVTDVKQEEHWSLGVKPDLMLTVPSWLEEAENGSRN